MMAVQQGLEDFSEQNLEASQQHNKLLQLHTLAKLITHYAMLMLTEMQKLSKVKCLEVCSI